MRKTGIKILFIILLISLFNFSYNNNSQVFNNSEALFKHSIDASEENIDKYIDVSYYIGKNENIEKRKLNHEALEEDCYKFEEEQYNVIVNTVEDVINELTNEEYMYLQSLSKGNNEIEEMLLIARTDSNKNEKKVNFKKDSNKKYSSTYLDLERLLILQKVCETAISVLKGAFNTMIATVKTWYIPSKVKLVIITSAILLVTTVVVVNWEKIKPIIRDVVNIFLSKAESFVNSIKEVFDSICNLAQSSASNQVDSIVFDDFILNNMGEYNLTKKQIKELIEEFTKIDLNKNNKQNTVYLGVMESKYYQIAESNEGIAFHVSDSRWEELSNILGIDGMWLVNRAFLNYVVLKKWEIILVSNPSFYYNLLNQKRLTERMYSYELEYLCKEKGAKWHREGTYWRIDKAW